MIPIFIYFLIFKSGGDDRHGAVLGADKSTDFYSGLVCLADRFASEDLCHERTGKGVPCAYGIGNGDLRCRQERGLGA
jgi:hypothetical protein